jgi:hypothetical protein
METNIRYTVMLFEAYFLKVNQRFLSLNAIYSELSVKYVAQVTCMIFHGNPESSANPNRPFLTKEFHYFRSFFHHQIF